MPHLQFPAMDPDEASLDEEGLSLFFEEALRFSRRIVEKLAGAALGHHEQQEATQDCAIAIWQSLENYDAERVPFHHYASRIVRYTITDILRKKGNALALVSANTEIYYAASSGDPLRCAELNELLEMLLREAEALSPDQCLLVQEKIRTAAALTHEIALDKILEERLITKERAENMLQKGMKKFRDRVFVRKVGAQWGTSRQK